MTFISAWYARLLRQEVKMPTPTVCPECKSDSIHYREDGKYDGEEIWQCNYCGHRWDIIPGK
jgi:ribosomal protein L37AE/L43A